jgi:ketosteroid isomerase-like protein
MRKLNLLTLITFLGIFGCKENMDMNKEKEYLIKTDTEFSKMSSEKNAAEAFYTYFANDGIQIRPNGEPIVGREAIREHLSSGGKFALTWEPKNAEVANSNELGYTWGVYKTTFLGPNGEQLERTGKYLTVWKKQPDGKWKVAVDIGNQDQQKENKN